MNQNHYLSSSTSIGNNNNTSKQRLLPRRSPSPLPFAHPGEPDPRRVVQVHLQPERRIAARNFCSLLGSSSTTATPTKPPPLQPSDLYSKEKVMSIGSNSGGAAFCCGRRRNKCDDEDKPSSIVAYHAPEEKKRRLISVLASTNPQQDDVIVVDAAAASNKPTSHSNDPFHSHSERFQRSNDGQHHQGQQPWFPIKTSPIVAAASRLGAAAAAAAATGNREEATAIATTMNAPYSSTTTNHHQQAHRGGSFRFHQPLKPLPKKKKVSACRGKTWKTRKWTQEEDNKMMSILKELGTTSTSAAGDADATTTWTTVATKLNTGRNCKQCRDRWQNYLRGGIKKGDWSLEEMDLIKDMHTTFGNRWSCMTKILQHRSENDIKNKWYSMVRKEKRLCNLLQGSLGAAMADAASVATAARSGGGGGGGSGTTASATADGDNNNDNNYIGRHDEGVIAAVVRNMNKKFTSVDQAVLQMSQQHHQQQRQRQQRAAVAAASTATATAPSTENNRHPHHAMLANDDNCVAATTHPAQLLHQQQQQRHEQQNKPPRQQQR